MKNVTIIIPLGGLNEKNVSLFEKSIKSIHNNKYKEKRVLLIGSNDEISIASKIIEGFSDKELKIDFTVSGEKSFEGKINEAVYKCVTPYFSIVGFDDEITSFWLQSYCNDIDKGQYSVSLCLHQINDINTNSMIGFGNEMALNALSTEELGLINDNTLSICSNFSLLGAVIRTEDYLNIGGMKKELSYMSSYEYMLRSLTFGNSLYVHPKVGYLRNIGREGSINTSIIGNANDEEIKNMIKLAGEQRFFKEFNSKD